MSAIASFYSGRSVLVTGFTGFLGKVLAEKLLRCSPGVKIYALIRPQAGKDADKRLQDILKNRLFDNVRSMRPNFHQNVFALCGDVTEPTMGLTDEDVETLSKEISIVFHVAATVKFDEELKVSLALNVVAVQHMLAVCKRLPKLTALVHVSTAYSNCDRSHIDEMVYNPSVQPSKLIDSLKWMDSDMVNSLTPKLLRSHPNTYTYSKCLAEYVLVQDGSQLPFAIFRPSIVGASWKEPTPGWIDNMNGPSGLFVAAGKGVLRVMKMSSEAIADIVPVDTCINMMLCIGWYTSTAKPQPGLVYHCNSGTHNPCKWSTLCQMVIKTYHKYPFDKIIRRPNFSDVDNNFVYLYWKFVSHLMPAYFMDLFARMFGKKPRMVQAIGKLEKALTTLDFFTQRMWHWTHVNGDRLLAKLSPEDKQHFDFDVRGLDWEKYYETFAVGIKKFVLHEDLSNIPNARRQIIKFRSIRLLFNTTLFLCVSSYLIKYSKWARAVVFSLVHFCLHFLSKVGLLSSGGVTTV
eukprot:m.309396 g.309396  ORF g.309396 m.309396 type:complete len:518 (+) comp46321_c0_seq1:89-1642(+)